MQQQKKVIFRIKNIKPIKFRTTRLISYVTKRTPSSTLLFRLFYFVFSFKTRPIHANKSILNSFFFLLQRIQKYIIRRQSLFFKL